MTEHTSNTNAQTILERKYTESHEWIYIDDSANSPIGTVGISSHAQEEIGEIVYIELPAVGNSIERGDVIAVVESTKAAADIYSPVSGQIKAINKTLQEDLRFLNEDPQNRGWLCEIILADPEELNDLVEEKEYLQWIEQGENRSDTDE